MFRWNGTYWQYSYFPYLPLRTLRSVEKMVAQECMKNVGGKLCLSYRKGRKKYLVFRCDHRGEGTLVISDLDDIVLVMDVNIYLPCSVMIAQSNASLDRLVHFHSVNIHHSHGPATFVA